jgi:hypothetical protein
MQTWNDDDTDGSVWLNTGTNALAYWNEDMTEPVVIASAIDLDGDGYITVADNGWGRYGNQGICSIPSSGIDENGTIYVTYSALVENTADPDLKSLRHTYIIYSTDGGVSWSSPFDIVSDAAAEGVYASVARNSTGGVVDIVYQKDYCAGNAFTQEDPCNNGNINEIVAVEYVPSVGISILAQGGNQITAYPNPVSDLLQINLTSDADGLATIQFSNLLGAVTAVHSVEFRNGKASLSVSGMSAGIYSLNVRMGAVAAVTSVVVAE